MTYIKFFCALCALFCAGFCFAQRSLQSALPLLQKPFRTQAENQQVLQLFRTAKDPSTVFAAGASLVKTPPAKTQEAALFNLVLKEDDPLKKVFAAVVITAMGSVHEELAPVLFDAAKSEDPALRSYAASAYVILNPQEEALAPQVINMYIYDRNFAQRAMNLLAPTSKKQFAYLKQATQDPFVQVRAAAAQWLGDLQTQDASKLLLKMAAEELDPAVSSTLAEALAKSKQFTLPDVTKKLKTSYTAPQAATYALALGFMTGSAIDSIKKEMESKDTDARINAVRAAAYMAGVLGSEEVNIYSQDPALDTRLLKSLIPQLNAMVKKDNSSIKVYADMALRQIAKLMR